MIIMWSVSPPQASLPPTANLHSLHCGSLSAPALMPEYGLQERQSPSPGWTGPPGAPRGGLTALTTAMARHPLRIRDDRPPRVIGITLSRVQALHTSQGCHSVMWHRMTIALSESLQGKKWASSSTALLYFPRIVV